MPGGVRVSRISHSTRCTSSLPLDSSQALRDAALRRATSCARQGRPATAVVASSRSSVCSGQPSEPPDPAEVTAAGFFGLRPLTDRVVLVLDRSGSMDTAFEGGARTRYEEATEQLLALLESLGPRTRFRVILFSSEKRVWSDKLRPATPANLGLVRTWMGNNGPGGATQLQPAVAAAMRLGSRGQVDLARLEADTMIVLCDGATAEGPHWMRPLMEGPNEEACLLFHSVQIGTAGDGTLERLAEESEGDFVRVRG